MSDYVAKQATSNGWRSDRGDPALAEVHGSIGIRTHGPTWRRALSFMGPGYLVAVGYMDPGNWATSLAGGSQFGYMLLSVVLLSSLMAMLLQALSARLAIATGRDLAQACRDSFPAFVNIPLWVLAEIAIIATDIAEVIGTAIGLQLLFGIPLEIGVLITALDVFLILWLQRMGFRWVEIFIITLTAVIGFCFALQLFLARPEWTAVGLGFVPSTELFTNSQVLYIAIGIIGATVMPHNLYLHSGIVQIRKLPQDLPGRREALRFATLDSTIALCFALLINASILILAAAAFHANGRHDVAELGEAHALLTPLLGSTIAPILFGVALLCSGLNSTTTATLSGQIVMEGFIRFKIKPWVRRLITRAIAIIPAALVTIWYGEKGTSELLILSQVVLSLQLPFAIFPLVWFTSSRRKMGPLTAPLRISLVAMAIAVLISALNIKLVYDFFTGA